MSKLPFKFDLNDWKNTKVFLEDEENYRAIISALSQMLVQPLDNISEVDNTVFSSFELYELFLRYCMVISNHIPYLDAEYGCITHHSHEPGDKLSVFLSENSSTTNKYFSDKFLIKLPDYPEYCSLSDGEKSIRYRGRYYNTKNIQSFYASILSGAIIRYYAFKCPLSEYGAPFWKITKDEKEYLKKNVDEIINFYFDSYSDKSLINNTQYLLCYLIESGIASVTDIDKLNTKIEKALKDTPSSHNDRERLLGIITKAKEDGANHNVTYELSLYSSLDHSISKNSIDNANSFLSIEDNFKLTKALVSYYLGSIYNYESYIKGLNWTNSLFYLPMSVIEKSRLAKAFVDKIDSYYGKNVSAEEYRAVIITMTIRLGAMECPLYKISKTKISGLSKKMIDPLIAYCLKYISNSYNRTSYDCYLVDTGIIRPIDMNKLPEFNTEKEKKAFIIQNNPTPGSKIYDIFEQFYARNKQIIYNEAVNDYKYFENEEIRTASANLASMISEQICNNPEKLYELKEIFLYQSSQENIELYKKALKALMDFTKIISSRLKITNHQKEVCWHFFCKSVLKKYAEKWIANSSIGAIGKLSVSKYTNLCLVNDLLPEGDVNSQTSFVYYILLTKYSDNCTDFQKSKCDEILKIIADEREKISVSSFEKMLFNKETHKNVKLITIDDVDMMDGFEFEEFLAMLFTKMGYNTTVTKSTGDQGIDVVVEREGKKYGIQAKCYSGTVGNAAIQEAVAGKSFYNLDKVMVITNSHFTEAAIALARSNGVVIWDREILEEKLHYINE